MANYLLTDSRNFTILNWLDKIEGPISLTNSALAAAKMENDDDPWDWSIDRVVQEFCTANRSWQLRSASMIMPDSAALEIALRDQQVTGDTLLSEVNDATMRSDLGLQTMGQRAFVMHGISALRLRSSKYRAANASQQRPAISRAMLEELARMIRISSEGFAEQSQHAQNDTPIIQGLGLPNSTGAAGHDIEEVEDSPHGTKRQKSDKLEPPTELDHSFADMEGGQGMLTLSPAYPAEFVDANGKKRKRIQPTLITPEIDYNRTRHIPTAADMVTQPEPAPEPVPAPGVSFLDTDGRKRMVPVWQAEASHVSEVSTISNAISSAPQKKMSKPAKRAPEYLGRQKMTVDQLFYPDVSVGEELPEGSIDGAEEFSMISTGIPNGKRLYVHNVMKRFLQNEPRQFRRQDEVFTAVLPYPEGLTLKYHQQSFSLYSSGSARREHVESWPELSTAVPSYQTIDARTSAFNLTGPGILGQLGRYEEAFDPSYLENKYKYLEGGDEILPLYGESDEENEYDLATWKEMEEEQGELQRITKPTRHPHLSLDDIDEAIDEGFVTLVERWTSQKLPKLQNRGYKIWRRSRSEGSKNVRIMAAEADLQHINRRIAKMRKELLEDNWTSKVHVLKQVPIFEVNIFAREELTWRIGILNQGFCPPKPSASVVIPKEVPNLPHEDEGESINSEDNFSSSDDGLGDFLVEDELLPSTEQELHELKLADTEDESDDREDSDSDANISDESQSTPLLPPSPHNVGTPFKTEGASLPPHRVHSNPHEPEVYDLTMMSSDDSPASTGPESTGRANPGFGSTGLGNTDIVVDLVTPKPKVKLNIRPDQQDFSPIVIEASDDESILGDDPLPPLSDPAAVAKKSYVFWAKVLDRNRLLVRMFYKMETNLRKSMLHFISNLSQQDLWGHLFTVKEALHEFHKRRKEMRKNHFAGVRGMDKSTLLILQGYIMLFTSYLDCCFYAWRETPGPSSVSKLKSDNAGRFASFFELCCTIQKIFSQDILSQAKLKPPKRMVMDDLSSDHDSDEDARLPTKRKRSLDVSEEDDIPPVSSQKRKRKIVENKEARDKREQVVRHLAEQEERRKALHATLAKESHGNNEAHHGRIIINDAAGDDENLIYVNPQTSSRIKPHQVDGIRFMWNQVVAGGASDELLQGCLLAHTMGLGKTMQVITLLVAIAEAAASIDPLISKQIPDRLKKSQTLVLCPATLVGNWMDELLMWVPRGTLGNMEKITAHQSMSERLSKIEDWYDDGGVLVIGYEMFRNLVVNKARKGGATSLSEEGHENVLKHLLEGPNIIIADEAHKMKNAGSGLTEAAMRFTSNSRIALTGSPLANNVVEYFSMIEWVAPKYLGPIVEFKAKYVEPIEIGLWQDSTGAERRRAFKMLKVLNDTLAPKVNRADMSVMRDVLPPKKEFVIVHELTPLQKQLYTLYVTTMATTKVSTTKSGDITQSTIWHWLGILSLICNHPRCLDAKMNDSKRASTDEDSHISDGLPDIDGPVPKGVLPREFTQEATKLLQDAATSALGSLSHKVQILCQILKASEAAGDKTLVFSMSIPTLDLLEKILWKEKFKFTRLDGSTPMQKRQEMTKNFNHGSTTNIFLISTKAGGLGLNLFGANRVVIFDFGFNPTWEEQAVGRAYRIGQEKPTFVYRLVAGGTFEEHVHNKTVFKQQLAKTVVDKKIMVAQASRMRKEILCVPKDVERHDLSEFEGMDPAVLDGILATQGEGGPICKIVQTDTFEKDDVDHKLTVEELQDAQRMFEDGQLKRTNPKKWEALQAKERQRLHEAASKEAAQRSQAYAASLAQQHQQPSQPYTIPAAQQQQQLRQTVNVTHQQNQKAAQSATTGQAIIQAAAFGPNRSSDKPTSSIAPALQSPTPEIRQQNPNARLETPLQTRQHSSILSESPHSSSGKVGKSGTNYMQVLKDFLKSAALSNGDPDLADPDSAMIRGNTLGSDIMHRIEYVYQERRQRVTAVKAAHHALQNDPKQTESLMKSTMSIENFIKSLVIPDLISSSVAVEERPSVGFSSISQRPEVPPSSTTPHSESQQTHKETGSPPVSSDNLSKSSGDNVLDFEKMSMNELQQYLSDHGKTSGTSRSDCISQCIAVASRNDIKQSQPLRYGSQNVVAEPPSVAVDGSLKTKPGFFERIVNSIM